MDLHPISIDPFVPPADWKMHRPTARNPRIRERQDGRLFRLPLQQAGAVRPEGLSMPEPKFRTYWKEAEK